MRDQTAIFEAFFKPVDGGYYFFTHRFSRGYSITESERDQMVEAFRRRWEIRSAGTIILAVVLVFAAIGAAALLFEYDRWVLWLVLALAFVGFIGYQRWSMREVLRPIRGRRPDAARRDSEEFDIAICRAWGRTGLWIVVAITMSGLIVLKRLWDDPSAGTFILSAVWASAVFLIWRAIFRTLIANNRERI